MKTNITLVIGLVSFLLLTGIIPVKADEGIRMNYAEIVLKNLGIGGTYNMTDVANLPLTITNSTDQNQVFELSVIQPSMANKLKKGYQPIPDPTWIKLQDQVVAIKAKSSYRGDVVITIPDNDQFLGKNYQVFIQAKQKTGSQGLALTLAIRGRILFSVAPVKLATGDINQTKVDLSFSISPPRIELNQIALGKKNAVMDDNQEWIKIQNNSDKTTDYYFESLNPKDTVIAIDTGYEACPDATFLTFAKEKIKLKQGREAPIEMYIEIPDQPEYRGKKYEFLGSARIGIGMSGIRYFRILVSTGNKEETQK